MDKRRLRRRRRRRRRQQRGGMVPGLIGAWIGNEIRKAQGKKPVSFDPKAYLKQGITDRIGIGKIAAGKKVPTPGNTGIPLERFLKGMVGLA